MSQTTQLGLAGYFPPKPHCSSHAPGGLFQGTWMGQQRYRRIALKYFTCGVAGKGSAFIAVVFGRPILHDAGGVGRQEVGDGLLSEKLETVVRHE